MGMQVNPGEFPLLGIIRKIRPQIYLLSKNFVDNY
jgi:hypothetical protein